MNNLPQLLCLGVLLFTAVSSLRADAPDQPPAGLSLSDWSALRAAYDAGRHRIAATAGGLQARNPGQQWKTRFDGQGFLVQPDGADWQWGLELTAYGFPGHEHTLPTGSATTLPDVAGSRLDYAWDAGLSEWFVNDARGLEHGFTVHERPADRQVLDCGSPLPLSMADGLTEFGALSGAKRQRTGAVQDVDATTSPLNFHLAIRGGLHPVLEPDGRGVRFVDAQGTTRTIYAGLKVWDADGKPLPAHFESLDAGHPGEITLAVDERGARYPLTIDPIAQQAYLKPAAVGTTQEGDWFGYSVAVSGDTVVVGAPLEDSSKPGVNSTPDDAIGRDGNAGAAYVFERSGTTWTQQAYLKPAAVGTAKFGDEFGFSVAVSGDTVVVGAPGESNGSGAAYVFVRRSGEWTQQAYLKARDTGLTSDSFGWSVAVSKDTVIVGAPRENSNATGVNGNQHGQGSTDSGAAYVFTRSVTLWTQQAYLKASNTGGDRDRVEGDSFGRTVAISADTLVVGAPWEGSAATGINGDQANNDAVESGAAYIFTRSGTNWTQQAYLKASNTGVGDRFGWSTAISGDTVVVGAFLEDSKATGVNGDQDNNQGNDSGAAYVFTRSGKTWIQQAYLKGSNTGWYEWFGWSVAVSGNTVVVGARRKSGTTTDVNGNLIYLGPAEAGEVYVFTRTDTGWIERANLKASSPGGGDWFGGAVSVSGDTIVVGAEGEDSDGMGVNGNQTDNGAIESGAAYTFVFERPELRVEQTNGAILTGRASVRSFGAVSVGGSTDSVFTVRNSGSTNLTNLTVTLDGLHADQFHVTANPSASVAPGESTTFTVRFSPTSEGPKTATLHLASNDPDHNPFDVTLVGTPNVPTVTTSGNDLTVSFVGTPGSRYRVQYLPGLTGPWNEFTPPALYTVPASGVFSHTDLNPPDTLRLYRAVLAP